jgi:hypothetical protein
MRAPPMKPEPPVTNAAGTPTTLPGQRFWMSSPHSHPLHGLCETSVTLALPSLSRVMRKLVHAVLFEIVVSMKPAEMPWSASGAHSK